MEQPLGFEINNNYINKDNNNKRLKIDDNTKIVCKLNKALYGLKQSPRLWYKHLLDICKELGFEILPFDEAIFINKELKIIIICHVDDLIITGPNKDKITKITTQMSIKLKLEYIGEINQFLGMEKKL